MAGLGFHTGRPNRLNLFATAGSAGWVRIGADEFAVWGDGSRPSAWARCTVSQGVGPLEHLSAAAVCAGCSGWMLEAEHADLPLFDGSAKSWFEAFRAIVPNGSSSPLVRTVSGFGSRRWESRRGGVLVAEPSDKFRLRVEWTAGPDGPETWEGDESTLCHALEARTFVEVDDWMEARKGGYLVGTDTASGRLLRGGNPSREALEMAIGLGVDPDLAVWTGGASRMPNECAAHKAVDLAGDIGCWIGYLPKLSIHVRDAGHDLHHLLGSALRESTGEV